MSDSLTNIGLKVAKYKCFGETPQGFDQILPFSLIIGRNNTGKSALLDLLAYIVTRRANEMLTLDGMTAKVVLSDTVKKTDLAPVTARWPANAVGRRISWLLQQGKQELSFIDENLAENLVGHLQAVVKSKQNLFAGCRFRRLTAERDIQPEAAGNPNIHETQNGNGATRSMHHFRTHASRDNTIVEETILNDLNAIFGSDAHFTKIDTRERDGNWEIYLDEAQKGRIPLSRSGSGLKTIVLVLEYLHLVPRVEGASIGTYLFGFEELENNLHPAIQRRLLHFLREFGLKHGCRFFLTTHSPVEIDYFARDEHAQVLHVGHDGKEATVTTLTSYGHRRRVLDDLDLRASDILQANGIIWVEGPSDRIYLNKWIELWTIGTLREGAHYQVLFYGGKLLNHLDAGDPDTISDTIHVLTTNRNACIVIDSDRAAQGDAINKTKQRLTEETTKAGGFAWTTAGREIENTLPPSLVREIAKLDVDPGLYDDITEAIIATPASPRRLTDKVALAQAVTPHLTRAYLEQVMELTTNLPILIEHIKRWNGE